MFKYFLFTLLLFCSVTYVSFAQVVHRGEKFERISVLENKVTFVKELSVTNITDKAKFDIIKAWARKIYAKSPFESTVMDDIANHEVILKTNQELTLPGFVLSFPPRINVVVYYKASAFLFQNKCVLEIKDLSYQLEPEKAKNGINAKLVAAEDLIEDQSLAKDAKTKEFKTKIRTATLDFVNLLAADFEQQF